MSTKILFSAIFLCALLLCKTSFGQDSKQAEYYPFSLITMNPQSIVNTGRLTLDAPAGRHGFLQKRNGQFFFADGTRARFWGTNLCFKAAFPTRHNAEILADRLAFFGFNAIRLHDIDYSFDPEGIFEDQDPAFNNPQMKRTTRLSKRQLDRLDYLIFQLKKHGIYVDISLLNSRRFTKADGVIDADHLGGAAIPVSVFDAQLIELQKQYAQDLLTHYNPYTKMRYADDPAIALIEITNENSIIDAVEIDTQLPDHYSQELDQYQKAWLNIKPHQTEDIKDFYIDLQHKYLTTMRSFLKNNCGIKVPVTGNAGYSMEENLQAQSDMDFSDKHAYWDHPYFPRQAWDNQDFSIQNTSLLEDKGLGFIDRFIGVGQKVKAHGQAFTISEWNHCYPNRFAYETPVLLAAQARAHDWDGLFEFDFSAGWHVAPILDNIDSYFSIMANPQKLILNAIASQVYLRAQDIRTTINNGVFRLNSPTLAGAEGRIKNIPLDLGPIQVRTSKDGAIFLYTADDKPIENSTRLILVNLGDVANTASGWSHGKFDWGQGPSRLENTGTQIIFIGNKKWQVFKLNSKGERSLKDINSPWTELLSD